MCSVRHRQAGGRRVVESAAPRQNHAALNVVGLINTWTLLFCYKEAERLVTHAYSVLPCAAAHCYRVPGAEYSIMTGKT
jgi:hypothetical protein